MAGLRTLLGRIKRQLFKLPFLKDKRYPAYWMDRLLGDQAAFLLQIGSNDGKTGDPFYPLLQKCTKWKALFVEPVPYFFDKLQKNYPNPRRFRFENVAINEGKKMTFYEVDPKAKETILDLPYWFDQLGSFNKQHILKHFDGALEDFILSRELKGISLNDLLNRNKIDSIDILHIDAEGYDWKILSQLDLTKFHPTFILFESNHLTQKERRAYKKFLEKEYWLFDLGIDILVVSKGIDNDLFEQMKQYMNLIP